MTLNRAYAGRRSLSLIAVGVAMLFSMVLVTSAAHAWRNEYFVSKLPGKTWTVGNGAVLEGQHFQYSAVQGEGPSTICIGPVQWNGSNYVFPYGWACGQTNAVSWEYPAITAAAGTDNPNSTIQHSVAAVAN